MACWFFFFQAEDGIRDLVRSRGLGDVYKRQLLSIPAFSKAFEYKEYKDFQSSFLQNINEGSKIPPKQLLISLLQKYIEFCGISLGYRTIVYDFAWSILLEHPELWYEQETQNGLCILADHFKEYIPGYNDSFDKFDVTVLNAVSYTHLDAADERSSVDLGGRRIINKKKKKLKR